MTAPATSVVRKASLFYFVFVMYSYTTGGPFGLEDQVTTSGPGMTLLYHLVLPFFWCIPVSLVSAEMTTAMPVEGGFYRWTRAVLRGLAGISLRLVELVSFVFAGRQSMRFSSRIILGTISRNSSDGNIISLLSRVIAWSHG